MEMLMNYMSLLKLIVCYFIMFILLPSLVLPADATHKGRMDRWMIGLIHSHFYLILLVHLLALLKLYETISLICAGFLIVGILLRLKYRRSSDLPARIKLISLLDLTDRPRELSRRAAGFASACLMSAWEMLRHYFARFLHNPVALTGIAFCFLFSAYVSFSHSMNHGYFASSDPYVHLKWAKLLSTNVLYVDGVYPYGFEAVIAGLNKLYLLDPYYIVRYIGPLTGSLILFTLYYALRKQYPNDRMFIFAVMLTIVGSYWLFGGYVWRQMSALSMEYGIIFFFPGMYFLTEHFRSGKMSSLLLAAECLALMVLIHPYVAVCAGAAYVFVFLFHLDHVIRARSLPRLVLVFLAAGTIGVLPLAVGILSGLEFHQTSVDFIVESVSLESAPPPEQGTLSRLWATYEGNRFFVLFLACLGALAVLLLAGAALRSRLAPFASDWRMNAVYLLLGLFFFYMYQAGTLGLPVFIPEYRLEIFFAFAASIVVALTLHQAVAFIRNRYVSGAVKFTAALLVFTHLFNNTGLAIPPPEQFQYDEAVDAYLDIRNRYPHQEWTIISPIEEYSMVLGYGWHYNLWEFVKDVTEGDKEEVIVPTNYVFLFVEKVPLGTERMVTEADASQPFPVLTGSRLDDYYRIQENRVILQAKAYYWAEEYRKTHKTLKIYLDSPHMRIYYLEQDGTRPYNLLK